MLQNALARLSDSTAIIECTPLEIYVNRLKEWYNEQPDDTIINLGLYPQICLNLVRKKDTITLITIMNDYTIITQRTLYAMIESICTYDNDQSITAQQIDFLDILLLFYEWKIPFKQ